MRLRGRYETRVKILQYFIGNGYLYVHICTLFKPILPMSMLVFSIAANNAGLKLNDPDREDQPIYLPINAYEVAKGKFSVSGKKKEVITLNPINWGSQSPKYIVDPSRTDTIPGYPAHNGDIDVLLDQLQDILQSVTIGTGGGTATEATLQSVLTVLQGDIDHESSWATDDSGSFFFVITQYDQENNVYLPPIYRDVSGASYVPVGTIVPVKGSDYELYSLCYIANNTGTGYSVGDKIELLNFFNTDVPTDPPVQVYFNVTTNSPIAAPTAGHLDSCPNSGTDRTVSATVTAVAGSVSAGAVSVMFYNNSVAFSGEILGVTLRPKEVRTFAAPSGDRLSAIAYDPTTGGATFEIHEIR